jgi:alkylation response protein AidB-like acyl-CoA dehydrogenase
MGGKYISERNLKFLLHDVFDVTSLTQYTYYREYDRKMFDMVIKAGLELADGLLWPNFQEMDRNPPELVQDSMKVHPSMKAIMKEFGEGGWIGITLPEDRGGQQMPHLIGDCCNLIFSAANYSATAYAILSSGAAHLIESFAGPDLFETYVPNIIEGKWQGTMALTEPDAGSSLADTVTQAEPTEHGYYLIQGQKIFISAGDHDAVENVVHMMLAKIPGAPPGVKGISLFIVPQKRIGEDGRLIPNDVVTSGTFHKLGYRGCPIVQLSIGDKGDCRGYLVGEPHKGLSYMFQMMNEERIGVGIGAAAMATAAYYASLDYSRIRRQGRRLTDKDPSLPQVPIIEHPDVKRMLLFQRAISEGSLSLLMQCSKYMDMQKVLEGEEKERYNLLLELLTPVAKTYPSEMGLLSISLGLQCFGGSGYCDDYTLEQYYRDARIHPIHEGTTGIHGIDLLGRKVIMKDGRAFQLYLEEIGKTIEEANKVTALQPYARQLSGAVETLKEVTALLKEVRKEKGPEIFLADATLYLEMFGITSIAWQWLLQGIQVQKGVEAELSEPDRDFFQGKMMTMRFFFLYELPKLRGLVERLSQSDGLTVEMKPEFFND